MSPKKKKSRGTHWEHLPRDSKGRWVKQSPKKGKTSKKSSKKSSKPSSKKGSATPNATKVEKILDDIKKEFDASCPRCGGNMKNFKIRCGPAKLIDVKKCILCNYWLPLQQNP